MLLGGYVALVIVIAAEWFRETRWFAPLVYLAAVIAAVSIGVPAFSLRCPKCRARWFWLAISQKHAEGWYKWLTTRLTCPVCNYVGMSGHNPISSHLS